MQMRSRSRRDGPPEPCCYCEGCRCSCHDDSLTPEERDIRIEERNRRIRRLNIEGALFCIGALLFMFVLFPLGAMWASGSFDEKGPQYIDVDGKRCLLYSAETGTYVSHGMTHHRYETRATCKETP